MQVGDWDIRGGPSAAEKESKEGVWDDRHQVMPAKSGGWRTNDKGQKHIRGQGVGGSALGR